MGSISNAGGKTASEGPIGSTAPTLGAEIAAVDGGGILRPLTITPTGEVYTQQDPTQIFYEDWASGVVDSTYSWNTAVTSGGATVAPSSGQVVFATGTTASSYSYLTSKQKFQPVSPGYLLYTEANQLSFPIPANTYAFWGCGNPAGSPAFGAYATEAVGFEINTSGILSAVTWAGGVRNLILTLVAPGNTNVHLYQIWLRGDKIYWVIDGAAVANIQTGALGPNVNTLPILLLAGNNSVAPGTSLSFTNAASYIGDSTGSENKIIAFPSVYAEATPTIATGTSTTILAGRMSPKYILIENNSAANIMISLSGNVLTGIVPSATNIGMVLTPGSSYESPPNSVPTSAITCYQTSGGSINTVYVVSA